jgi:hypothetical protein
VYAVSPVSLCCPFLIAPLIFSHVYLDKNSRIVLTTCPIVLFIRSSDNLKVVLQYLTFGEGVIRGNGVAVPSGV